MKKAILILMAAVLAAGGAAASDTLDRIKANGNIRIGYITGQEPFSSDASGKPQGFAIDLCKRVADDIRKSVPSAKASFVKTSLADAFKAVKEHRLDMVCGAVTMTLSRRVDVDFSQPFFMTGATAMLRTDSPAYLQKLFLGRDGGSASSAKPATIGVRAGTTNGAALRKALGPSAAKTRVVDFDNHDLGLEALEEKDIDAYFADRALLIGLFTKSKSQDKLVISENFYTREPYGIVLPRDDADFRLAVDRSLTRFFLSDDLSKTLGRYFGSEAPLLKEQILLQSIPE